MNIRNISMHQSFGVLLDNTLNNMYSTALNSGQNKKQVLEDTAIINNTFSKGTLKVDEAGDVYLSPLLFYEYKWLCHINLSNKKTNTCIKNIHKIANALSNKVNHSLGSNQLLMQE